MGKTRPYTRLPKLRVGAVMKIANPSVWAGAEMHKTPDNAGKTEKANSDRRMDGLTNQHSEL